MPQTRRWMGLSLAVATVLALLFSVRRRGRPALGTAALSETYIYPLSKAARESDVDLRRMHGHARLLLANTIMAQGARKDLAKVAGGSDSR